MSDNNALTVVDNQTGEIQQFTLMSPKVAIERAREAKQARDEFIKEILVKDVDYGFPPGTEPKEGEKTVRKPSLFKGGAEKITDGYNLYPQYEPLNCIEDWEGKLWVYRYRCCLKVRGTEVIVASGIGSCNSRESKYAFRNAQRICPECGKPAIIKGKAEYGGGWLCFKKNGGCGSKFPDNSPEILNQDTGKVANENIADLVNTIDKMAQKRAFVAANLCLGFSAVFTQDIEDHPPEVFGYPANQPAVQNQQPIEEAKTEPVDQYSQYQEVHPPQDQTHASSSLVKGWEGKFNSCANLTALDTLEREWQKYYHQHKDWSNYDKVTQYFKDLIKSRRDALDPPRDDSEAAAAFNASLDTIDQQRLATEIAALHDLTGAMLAKHKERIVSEISGMGKTAAADALWKLYSNKLATLPA